MGLVYNGTAIPSDGTIKYNGTSLTKLIFNSVVVWVKEKIISSITLALKSSSLSGSNANTKSCTVSGNTVNLAINGGAYGTYDFSCSGPSIDCTDYTKATVYFTCQSGVNGGNYNYMTLAPAIGSKSGSGNTISKTSGTITIDISALSGNQSFVLNGSWKLNYNYSTNWTQNVSITKIVLN